jgi:hypothetical protein
MPDFIFDLPMAVTGPGIVAGLVLFAVIGLRLTRTHVLPRLRIDPGDSEFASAMLQAVMAFYGLALALIAVSVWQAYADVSKTLSQEATSLGALYRDVSGYPEPTRGQLQTELRDYTRQIFQEAWPLQRHGQIPTRGVEQMNQFQKILIAFEPVSEGQKLLHGEALRAYNQVIQFRRQRLETVSTGLPGIMWFLVIVGAVIGIVTSFFFKVQDERYHRLLVVLLAILVGLVIFMITELDHPYRGDLGLQPDSYQLIYDHLMNP